MSRRISPVMLFVSLTKSDEIFEFRAEGCGESEIRNMQDRAECFVFKPETVLERTKYKGRAAALEKRNRPLPALLCVIAGDSGCDEETAINNCLNYLEGKLGNRWISFAQRSRKTAESVRLMTMTKEERNALRQEEKVREVAARLAKEAERRAIEPQQMGML